ncbi:YceD family protein [Primorskyibacter sp. 2E107]|uniref:YceD family protein n=1 Tax=Primorskyibacter sp. 2E107 TaxID=3403458 RepID=UPI003AF70A60
MSKSVTETLRLRVSELRQRRETPFLLEPGADTRAAIAGTIGAEAVKKLRFEGTLAPRGKYGWELRATLGATAVQPCIVTLEPVTTRIDTEVLRRFVPEDQMAATVEAGEETEMPEDDSLEPLGDVIDLDAVMTEALSLALPSYPRKDDADLGEAVFTEDGTEPLKDADLKPFAGLAALRDKMQGTDE